MPCSAWLSVSVCPVAPPPAQGEIGDCQAIETPMCLHSADENLIWPCLLNVKMKACYITHTMCHS